MMVTRKIFNLVMSAVVFLSTTAFVNVPVWANGEQPPYPEEADEIVVKFKPDVSLPYEDGVEPEVLEQGDIPLTGAFAAFPDLKFNRLFSIYDSPSHGTDSPSDVFHQYFTIPVPKGADQGKLLQQLKQSALIEAAYMKPKPVEDPAVDFVANTTPVQSGDDPYFSSQQYFHVAPLGHDAPYAWQFEGGDGKGIAWVDVERGWALGHEDLAAHQIPMLPGSTNYPSSSDHGTAVLGVVSAVDNTIGTIGLANKAKPMVSSTIRSVGGYNIAEAIIVAADALQAGDVILLEVQTTYSTASGYVPIEVYPAEFDAIRYAVNKGVTVVEAAGNGSVDLDAFQDWEGKYVLNRNSPGFKDSGAIMVGASSSSALHTRLSFSNYGTRIDTNSWGYNVYTLAAANPNSTTGYQSGFSGTSSASSVITATVVSLQGIAKAQFGIPYSPDEVRSLLSNPAYNTPTNNPVSDLIGYLPDMKKLIDNLSAPVIDLTSPSVPANLVIGDKSSHSATLAWSASTDNVRVVHYEIWRGNSKIGTSITTSFTDSGLTASTAYSYMVKAVDAAGNISAASSVLTVTTDIAKEVTVYYKQGYGTPYIHYRPAGGSWTTPPGVAMSASEVPGYNKLTVDVGSANGLEAVFNDGNGNWDNNYENNFHFPLGVSTFDSGSITSGAPAANIVTVYYKQGYTSPHIHYRPVGGTWTNSPGDVMPASEVPGYNKAIINVGSASGLEAVFNNGSGSWDNNNGNNYYFPLGASTIVSGTIVAGAPVVHTATIYYKRGFATPYIHWRPEGGSWTSIPGQVMQNSEVAGYSKITLSLGSANRAEVCFNNGSGSWNSNNGNNYWFNAGTSTLNNGSITSGTPH